MFLTAIETPFPKNLDGSPSRSSTASLLPVEAPEGTDDLAQIPLFRVISASTVGLPLESSICLPCTDLISDMSRSFIEYLSLSFAKKL